MTADTLPDEVDFVFRTEALPEEDVHCIVLVIKGMGASIPTSQVTLTDEDGHRLGDRLNCRLGHRYRESWNAFVARCLRAGASGGGTPH